MRRHRTAFLIVATLLFALLTIGCDQPSPPVLVDAAPPAEVPVACNLPVSMRQTNWLYSGEGSCAVASLCSHVNWQNDVATAKRLRAHYGGGQTATSVQDICRAEKLPYRYTTTSDPMFLEWASRTRRGAIIWFFPAHCVTFCGFTTGENGDRHAIILDNNRVGTPIKMNAQQFLRDWNGYGGFALTVLGPPAPEPFYERWNPCDLDPLSRPSRPSVLRCSLPSSAPDAFLTESSAKMTKHPTTAEDRSAAIAIEATLTATTAHAIVRNATAATAPMVNAPQTVLTVAVHEDRSTPVHR